MTDPRSTTMAVGPLPPTIQIDDFLSAADHSALLAWALANRARFKPATVTDGTTHRTDDRTRIALKLADLGPLESRLREKLLSALPQIVDAIGGRLPDTPSLELELTAYGDGAFYGLHRDIPIGPARQTLGAEPGQDRLLSAVYYFHREPKAFSGGALRLYRWGADLDEAGPSDWRDIEPRQNSLAGFPSWAVHEVRVVACPSCQFEDSRFAINCWYCATLGSLSGA